MFYLEVNDNRSAAEIGSLHKFCLEIIDPTIISNSSNCIGVIRK